MLLFSLYKPAYSRTLVYMLQSTEYQIGPYLRWFWRTANFGNVMQRRTLELTSPARLLLWALRCGMFLQLAIGIGLVLQTFWQGIGCGWQLGLALIVSYPVVWAHLVVVPLQLGRWLVIRPRQARAVRRSQKLFAAHPGIRLAVVGSYGKTSMKELLKTVLGEAKKVAATPANRNVAGSHAAFAHSLQGDEDVLIIEYGEGQPGDVARLARQTKPTHAVITGLSPAHLDRYRKLERAAKDIFSVARFVEAGRTYVNADSPDAKPYITDDMSTYCADGALGWQISDVQVSAQGTNFTVSSTLRTLKLSSGLLGRHNVGPLAFAAAFALKQGMSDQQVIDGIAKTQPFEHRMQPRSLSGALLIDDTYNGNLEGIRAGTALLRELPARRKWYVTPGLVDQGRLTIKVHHEIGRLIAEANPDTVVLMDNSVCDYIVAGLKVAGYQGEVRVEKDPLAFYAGLPHFVAAGDVVMMQNDWTDNYS